MGKSSPPQTPAVSPGLSRFQLVAICTLSVAAIVLLVFTIWPPAAPKDFASPSTDDNPPAASVQGDPQSVFYFSPDDYYLKHAAVLVDSTGKTAHNTLLLPKTPAEVTNPGLERHDYIGAETCRECHEEYYKSFVETAHYSTSSPATAESVLGKFEASINRLETASPQLHFEMIDDGQALFQRVHLSSQQQAVPPDFQFGIVTGSGKVGQTYLYWKGHFLYQMHASYLRSLDSWVNSPGYRDGTADFARPILPLCLECHTTHVSNVPGTLQYSHQDMILGVTCEKCHGPGKKHADFHRANPDAAASVGIVNPGELSTDRQLDLCQQCHGGMPLSIRKPAFTYRPGDALDDFYEPNRSTKLAGIHSNSQLPRLQRSKCFTESESMTCADCHNPHQNERGNMRLFSGRCIECHAIDECGKFDSLGQSLAENCIDCHMPVRTMEDIIVESKEELFSPRMRDHFIKVWPTESSQFLKRPR